MFLQNYIQNAGIQKFIKIIKQTRNVKKFYLNSNLFVLTSLYEGFPNVLVESIMYNIPIISSNCKSGPKEILLNNKGPNIFRIKDHHGLSEKILNFSRNKKNFNKNNFKIKNNLNNFHYKKILNEFEKLFIRI